MFINIAIHKAFISHDSSLKNINIRKPYANKFMQIKSKGKT